MNDRLYFWGWLCAIKKPRKLPILRIEAGAFPVHNSRQAPMINKNISGIQVGMGEHRPVLTRVDGCNFVHCFIAHVFVDEERIEFRNLVKRTTYSGGETVIKYRATMAVTEAVQSLVRNRTYLRLRHSSGLSKVACAPSMRIYGKQNPAFVQTQPS